MRVADWLVPMLRTWSAQKKRALSGVRRFADGGVHAEGFNATSACAVAFEGRGTGGTGVRGQRLTEVYSGNGLRIWRIYSTSPEDVREIIFCHFIVNGPAWRKARELNISVPAYWQRLNSAYYYFAGRFDQIDKADHVASASPRPSRGHTAGSPP